MRQPLHIGLSISPTWLRGASWRRTDSEAEQMHTLSFVRRAAEMAEQAHLDFLFRADSLFLNPQALASSPGFSSTDPTVQLAALAAVTERIGLVTTASSTFYDPYLLARQLMSLHWMSEGRAGWNLVTSLDGAENFSQQSMPTAEARYDRAESFLQLVRQLWETYPAEAVTVDRQAGRYADPGLIRSMPEPLGEFDVAGPLTVPQHPAGSPPIFQAGASERGREFAAVHADAVFASAPTLQEAAGLRAELRARAERAGRTPEAVRLLPGLVLVLAETAEQAQDIHEAGKEPISDSARIARLSRVIGADLSDLELAQRIPESVLQKISQTPRSRTHQQLVLRLIRAEQPTLRELLRSPVGSPSAHWQVVGTPAQAATEIGRWQDAGAIDGVVALPSGSWRSVELFCREVIPQLVAEGRFRSDYTGTTLADHLGLHLPREPGADRR
ncbi:NtaA/DmoA family FMN-dependent monooxygenase [Nesterenkonia alba]|uniref:NtaA/DmoA family FMN-dependent monooxygenase n=1 Tax=Nesterenkonia alba TaxID=515814 RepID=UPI0003B5764B|nr:NtaA/DmoA family FMN-dependent monooxygenase [Nesterenkonia alba]